MIKYVLKLFILLKFDFLKKKYNGFNKQKSC